MLVGLHPFSDLFFCCSLLSGLEVFTPCVEIAAFATLGLHEYQRSLRMSGTYDIYKTIEILVDDFG